MVRLPTLVLPDKPCDNTASAALMKGWISSIFMDLDSRSSGVGYRTIFAHHVLDDFVENFRLDRFLHEMARAALQCRHNVFLIAHRRHHDDARLGMLLHNPFSRLDSFHLRHGDIHEHDVRMRAVELADGGQAVAGFSRHLPAERFDHAGQVLTGKYGVVHDQIADWLPVLAAFYWCKLLHTVLPLSTAYHAQLARTRSRWSQVPAVPDLSFRPALPGRRIPSILCFFRKGPATSPPSRPNPPRGWRIRVRSPPWACRTPRRTLRFAQSSCHLLSSPLLTLRRRR